MIDPITAFGLIKTAHASLMHAVQMKKDFASMGRQIANFAKGEAALSVIAADVALNSSMLYGNQYDMEAFMKMFE